MQGISINSSTSNPGSVIAEAIKGNSYGKVVIEELKIGREHCTILHNVNDKLIIKFRNFISCDKVEVEIDTLVVDDVAQLYKVPKFLLDQAKYVTIKQIGGVIPPNISDKFKRDVYNNSTKSEIKPNSVYFAHKLSDFEDVDLGNIIKLRLKADYEDLVDMVGYVQNHQTRAFKEITILYRPALHRPDAPFFDLSLLSDIKSSKISLNDSKYTGFRKFILATTIPYVAWDQSMNTEYHKLMTGTIKKELENDEYINVEDNYTLLKTRFIPPYDEIYEDVLNISTRNRELHYNKRFATTKGVKPNPRWF